MAQEGKEVIQALIERFPVCITYVPVGAEVDFRTICSIPESTDTYEIQSDPTLDPKNETANATDLAKERPTAILVPGRVFDATGTRHGKGAGWYDRFLSQAPSSWTRIGFCFNDQFASEPLIRESWDEPMDYIVVIARTSRTPSLYETKART